MIVKLVEQPALNQLRTVPYVVSFGDTEVTFMNIEEMEDALKKLSDITKFAILKFDEADEDAVRSMFPDYNVDYEYGWSS